MKWTSTKEIPSHLGDYMIITDSTVFYAYYNKLNDSFHLKTDFDVYGPCDIPGIQGEVIPRSKVRAYISLVEIYADYKNLDPIDY